MELRQRPGRRCGMCHHERRSELERRVLDGESFQSVSLDAGLSPPALYRHVRACLKLDLRTELAKRGATLAVRDFAQRLVELVGETEAVRALGHATGDGALVLKSVNAEASLLAFLTQRLGIDHLDTVDDLEQAHALATSCIRVLATRPDVLGAIVTDLNQQGHHDLSVALVAAAERRQAQTPTLVKKENLA